jgi:hypothetical protein
LAAHTSTFSQEMLKAKPAYCGYALLWRPAHLNARSRCAITT